MRMLQRRSDVDLRQKSLGAKYSGELRMYDLDCDFALMAEIFGEVDGGHSTFSKLALDTVLAGESRC
jgi:hypothetical protein